MVEHRIAFRRRSCPNEAPGADAARLLAPGRWTRLLAYSRHVALDRAIASGADLAASPLLAARAAQLTRACTRNEVAASLERVAALADGPYPRFRVVPRRAVVRQNRDELIELAMILRGDGPAYARGVALLERVVTDGAGPAYADGNGELLAAQLRHARERLAG
jgi:hypothetical protein